MASREYEISIGGRELTVVATYLRAQRGLFERGGGQITPDEPAGYEIESISEGGVELNAEEFDALYDDVVAALFESDEDPPERYDADAEYDRRVQEEIDDAIGL